jgi:hypothetical protein
MEESKPSSIHPNQVAQNTLPGETTPVAATGAAVGSVMIAVIFPPSAILFVFVAFYAAD